VYKRSCIKKWYTLNVKIRAFSVSLSFTHDDNWRTLVTKTLNDLQQFFLSALYKEDLYEEEVLTKLSQQEW